MVEIFSSPILVPVTVSGVFGGALVTSSTISLSLAFNGRFASSVLVTGSNSLISLSLTLSGDFSTDPRRTNWVAWSKIGEASFVLDLTNDAGFRPMEWPGLVFCVKKLGDRVAIYGTSGVTIMFPAPVRFAGDERGPTWGFKEVSKIGLKSKNSVCGDESTHYFVDRLSALWRLKEQSLERLGYEEYLETLANPSLFWDPYLGRLLISDATKGFIYTPAGLGGGYGNLSGWCYDSGTLRVGSTTGNLLHPPLEFTTDIVDFGRRGQKTIESVQVGTDSPEILQISYDFRYGHKESWRSTHWQRVGKEGVAYLRCAGVEFRIKLRTLVRHEFAVDYLNVQFKTTDQRYSRSALVGNVSESAFAGRVGQ